MNSIGLVVDGVRARAGGSFSRVMVSVSESPSRSEAAAERWSRSSWAAPGSTDIEKRAIFYKRLLPLLEFGREREELDLSKMMLTHHTLKARDKAAMPLGDGDAPLLDPLTEAGSGSVQEKQKIAFREIIEKVNTLFDGDLTDQDKLVYVNNVLFGKLLESTKLAQQASNNTKEQFANSPDLQNEITGAIMDALEAHETMSKQALNSPTVRSGIKDILLNHTKLWEMLRAKAG